MATITTVFRMFMIVVQVAVTEWAALVTTAMPSEAMDALHRPPAATQSLKNAEEEVILVQRLPTQEQQNAVVILKASVTISFVQAAAGPTVASYAFPTAYAHCRMGKMAGTEESERVEAVLVLWPASGWQTGGMLHV
jgi:hypothetical protein